MPQRLPNAPESRVLLALYHKGPLTKTQLVNLEAMSVSSVGAVHGLVEKTLVGTTDYKTYQLTAAGHDLCEVCLKYDLLIETHYRSDTLSREVARRSGAPEDLLRDFLEADFSEVRRELRITAETALDLAAPGNSPPQAALIEPPGEAPPPAAPVSAPITSPIAAKPAAKPVARITLPPPRIYSSAPRK